MKKNDRVKYKNGIFVGTVTKVYTEEKTGIKKAQVITENGFIFEKIDNFILEDEMLLRCNFCSNETYESELDVNTDNQMYVCKCGSSTFTPQNIDLDFEDELYNY